MDILTALEALRARLNTRPKGAKAGRADLRDWIAICYRCAVP
jgi:hypothetical protein